MKQGVVVIDVPATQLGIYPGDIIESINNKKVATIKEAAELLQALPPSWNLALSRGNKVMTLQVLGSE